MKLRTPRFRTANLKSILWLIILCIMFSVTKAQQKLPSIDYRPQSPAAAAYSRYGEIPVDYSTGVPKIEIPIYTVKVGSVEIPVNISYHASGNKVRDIPTEVGLGWALNYGGVVTANIVGKSDDEAGRVKPVAFKKSEDIDNAILNARNSGTKHQLAESYWEMLTMNANQCDYFSDRYNYSLCTGESGVFRKDYLTDSVRLMPYRPVNVNMHDVFIDIVASNGYTHYFKKAGTDFYTLNKIVSADKTDSIVYYYETPNVYHSSYGSLMDWRYEEIIQDPNFPSLLKLRTQLDGYNGYSNLSKTDANSYQTTPLIDSLVTKNEVISFQYDGGRQDKNSNGNILSKIIVKDRYSRQVIKTFELGHSYFGTVAGDNLRLRLDDISIYGAASDVVQKYSFNYNGTALPPYQSINSNNYYEDYWGYYNGVVKNNLLPSFYYNFNIPNAYNYADMNPNGSFAQACILTQINYPTGGKTVFEYEPNSLPREFPQQLLGGVRIKKVTSYTDAVSKTLTKTYEYTDAVTKQIVPANYWYQQECWVVYQHRDNAGNPDAPPTAAAYHKNTGFSSPLRPIVLSNGGSIIYTGVTEYLGEESANIGKTTYRYSYDEDAEFRNPMPGNIDTRFFNYYHSDGGNYTPELIGKTMYKFNNGVYELVKSEENQYTKYKAKEFNTGINFGSNVEVGIENWGCDRNQAFFAYDVGTYQHPDGTYSGGYDYLNSLVYTDTKGYEEVSLLASKIVKDYVNNNPALEVTTNFTYNNSYAQLSSQTTTSSKGETLTTNYKYPNDFTSDPTIGTVSQAMVAKNMLTPVIERSAYKGSNFLEATRTNYKDWGGSILAPETVVSKRLTENSNWDTRLRYHSYDDKGNVTAVSREGDVKTAYLWGYNKSYPIAQAVNATADQIAYTSFEEEGTGNWTLSSTARSTTNARTGTQCYNLSNGNMTKAGLDPAQPYIFSFWAKAGASVGATGTQSTLQGPTINGWTYWEKTLSGISTITVSGSGLIDEVRLYPTGAQVTTFTYAPLIGMTSQSDANGRTTYYEYDAAGRLSVIRDQDHHILKKYCYNYAGQPEQCSVFFNEALSGYYYSQSCGSQTPAPYYVSVPQGLFTSSVSPQDANQQAQQYAQSQANQNGTCQPASIPLYYTNYSGNGYALELYNTDTGQSYWFTAYSGSGTLGDVPAGNYDVYISPFTYYSYQYYSAGCGYYSSGYYGASFYSMSLNSGCNYFQMY